MEVEVLNSAFSKAEIRNSLYQEIQLKKINFQRENNAIKLLSMYTINHC